MADDIAAAMVATMDDGELQAHVAGLRERLWALPQGGEDRGPLLAQFELACAELGARGIYGDGGPDGYAIRGDGAEADVIDGAAFWDEGPARVTRATSGYCESGAHGVAVILPAAYRVEEPGAPARGMCERCAAPFIAEYGVTDGGAR